ncbi:MAG TPA: gliding motility-associated C-terminal domain-containing protein, partial [Chitinophagales bacterium]|nr:gliding motility-associated C-terminal domain-containing protein [Chitinophagales bacterium]
GVDPYHLNDIKTWRIYVVPPPVQGLTATATHSSVVLNWQNPYTCAGDENFRGFTVWRKVGCDSTDFDHCHTGLAGSGYVKLTANNISAYTYTDNTVIPGQAYSYRVLAEFYKLPPNGVITLQYDNQESVPSEKVCVNAPVSLPVILNADVMQTDAVNGQIYVRWAKPLAGGVNLDTVQDAPPYRFDLYHGDGFNLNNPALINSVTYNAYYLIPDTVSFIDNALNTQDGPWSYQVKFYANNNGPVVDTVGNSEIASSIYLSIHPSDQSLGLNWSYNVPWSNDSFTVFKRVNSTGIFDSIGVAYTSVYTDTSLINDTSYCYYVKGWGHYTSGLFPQPLINRSQKQCAVPIDTTAPCPPTLVVTNDCDQYNGQPWTAAQYVNHLKWTNNPDSCSADIVHYHIYYNPTDSGGFSLIDSLTSRDDTTYDHVLNDNLAGCYAVTAIDRAGNESRLSNIVCIDDCPYYVLPNAFTPNGDGANDKFHPFLPYRFVPKIEMKIYNRWGELMFETTDPMINWDGTDKSGNKVGDGVYLYAGYYYEQHLNGLVKKPLGNGKKGGGYIHLIRGK